jgi:hypothetical protein
MVVINLSRDYIIEFYVNPLVLSCFYTKEFGNKVVKLNFEMVVKFGKVVREREIVN